MSGIAFVAGATGYTGRHVVEAGLAHGFDTIAHVRPDSSRLEHWTEHFGGLGARVDATAWEPAAMAATLQALKPTVVFALLGTTRARGKQASADNPETYETIDYGLTVMLLEAAMVCGSRPRFVYLSSTGVGPGARGAYMSARWRAEERVRQSQLDYVIARPSVITGPDRDEARTGERLGGAALDGVLGVLGALGARKLSDRYRSTSGQALGSALVRLAADPEIQSRVYESDALR